MKLGYFTAQEFADRVSRLMQEEAEKRAASQRKR
jgi:hypothetical protein